MDYEIRNVRAADLEAVLALNESEVPHVGSIGLNQLAWFADNAAYFRVTARGDDIDGYLVGMRPGTGYASPNYRWFCEHYEDFAYIDRVAVAAHARRRGLATRLYEDFRSTVAGVVNIMTCEVNIRPANQTSMHFHRQLGFDQVGTLESADGAKAVALLARPVTQ
jgi:predicted GNAT superfamily acetyltransferase